MSNKHFERASQQQQQHQQSWEHSRIRCRRRIPLIIRMLSRSGVERENPPRDDSTQNKTKECNDCQQKSVLCVMKAEERKGEQKWGLKRGVFWEKRGKKTPNINKTDVCYLKLGWMFSIFAVLRDVAPLVL